MTARTARFAAEPAGTRRRLVVATVLCVLVCLLGLCGPVIETGASKLDTTRMVVASASAVPKGATARGPIDPNRPIEVDLVLRSATKAALGKRASAVGDPGSADYHRYLDPASFARLFGASNSAVSALRRTFEHEGITDVTLSSDRLFLRLRAPAREIEKAFATTITSIGLAGSTNAYANTTAASLPRSIAPLVSAVVGLDELGSQADNLLVEKAKAHAGASRVASQSDAIGAMTPAPSASCSEQLGGDEFFPSAVTTADLASAYRFTGLYQNGDYGAGQTVALIEFGPYLKSDIATFESCYRLSATSTPLAPKIKQIPVDEPHLQSPTQSGAISGNEVETELDLETLIGLVPEAHIDIYEAPNPNINAEALDAYIKAVDNRAVSVISTSWGDCEPQLGIAQIEAESLVFRQAAVEGKSVIAAAGDDGSTDCYGSVGGPQARALATDDPASQPYVTGVGGTTIEQLGPPPTEQAWNEGRSGASGGGVSGIWAMPSYQANSPSALGVVSTDSACPSHGADCREVPDVAADAGTPLEVYCTQGGPSGCSNGWSGIGGTSLAAPLWAALLTLADASSACHGVRIGFANPALYAIAGGGAGADAFDDVTTGSNDIGFTPGRYEAGSGYDLVTGLGTPIAGDGTDDGLVAQLGAATRPTSYPRAVSVPYIRAITPRTGRASGGRLVTITGVDFSKVSEVVFGSARARFRFAGPGKIIATAPPGAGTVDIRLKSSIGWSWRLTTTTFSYLKRR